LVAVAECVEVEGLMNLSQVAQARGAVRGFAGSRQCGKQDRDQQRDDADDDEEFDEGEGAWTLHSIDQT
jgi:hypothetical protein